MATNIKCLPYSSAGTVAIEDVTAMTITPDTRSELPYPPGKMQVNGNYWPDGKTYHGTVTLTWAHRIRTAQDQTAIVQQDAASTTGTIEGTYTVEVLIAGAVVRTQTGITGTSFAYTLAQRTADDADLTKLTAFRITPVSGTLSGAARTTDSFLMAA